MERGFIDQFDVVHALVSLLSFDGTRMVLTLSQRPSVDKKVQISKIELESGQDVDL